MAASANLSSARVAPRSVMRAAATSMITSAALFGGGLDRTGAGRVADGAEPDVHLLDLFVVLDVHERGDREEHAVAPEHLTAVRVVDRRELDLLDLDVLPHVELGPVRDGEHADVLALAVPAVEEVPQLGPLVLRVPLAELVAEGVHALLGPGLVLVAAAAAEDGVEAVLLDRVEERDALQPVADGLRARVLGRPGRRRSTPGPSRRPARHAELGDPAVPVVDDLGEVVARCRRASAGTGAAPARTPSRRPSA